jgi:undecaprenyl diphosphate synthase
MATSPRRNGALPSPSGDQASRRPGDKDERRPDLGGPFPAHIAVIMDGNGRWAESRGLRRIFGHKEGINSVREVTEECAQMGVESLTLYAFSVDNWKRPDPEVRYLMRLLRTFLVEERPRLMENGVRLRAIGRLTDLPASARAELQKTEEITRNNRGMLLRLALSYGSRTEVADAVRQIAEDAKSGALDPKDVDEQTLRAYLYDPTTPDPDLLIRTAGEMRLSNFLLWQISYAEFFVSPVCWPEFRREQLMDALRSYAGRQRKFGGLIQDHAPAPEKRRTGGGT